MVVIWIFPTLVLQYSILSSAYNLGFFHAAEHVEYVRAVPLKFDLSF